MAEHTSRKTYILVFLALMVLLVLSYFAALVDLGAANLPLALGISLAKAILVMLFFMHLLESRQLISMVAVGGILWLGFLFALTFSDYTTRQPNAITGPSLPVIDLNEEEATEH